MDLDISKCGHRYHYIGEVKFYDELPRYIQDGVVMKVLYRGNIGDKEIYPLNRIYIRIEGRWQELHDNICHTLYLMELEGEEEEEDGRD